MTTELEKKILRFLVLFFAFFITGQYIFAFWQEPEADPPGRNVSLPINVSGEFQTNEDGTVILNNLFVSRGAIMNKIEVGFDSFGEGGAGRESVSVKEKTKGIGSFCLGKIPRPNGCISSWLDLSSIVSGGLSGGQTNYLAKWVSPTSINGGNSSIVETETKISISKKVEIDSGAAGTSGLKLVKLANPASFTGLARKNKVLTLDANGNIVLANVSCSTP